MHILMVCVGLWLAGFVGFMAAVRRAPKHHRHPDVYVFAIAWPITAGVATYFSFRQWLAHWARNEK